jgi:L-lactate dehydrogenase complex protein LldG
MIEQFMEKALLAGAEIEHVAGLSGAARTIKEFLEKNNLKTALISPELKMRSPFDTEFAGFRTVLPADALWVDAGIVAADHGVAETGTLVHFDQSDSEKNVWTLPEVCLCLLDRRRIVADLSALGPEFAGHLGRTDISSPQISLVTGPSRTADIECQLTIGVHGPSRLIILIL